MEADWEIEIGPDAPIIDAAWAGYVDLHTAPERVAEISEAAQFPALSDALVRLNSLSSCIRTVKCDLWPVNTSDPAAFDADEMDADREDATSALACYIDLIPVDALGSRTLDEIADWSKRLRAALKLRPLRQCRADAIVRRAFLAPGNEAIGVTAYIAACGASAAQAADMLSAALALFTESILAVCAVDQRSSKYNQSIVGG